MFRKSLLLIFLVIFFAGCATFTTSKQEMEKMRLKMQTLERDLQNLRKENLALKEERKIWEKELEKIKEKFREVKRALEEEKRKTQILKKEVERLRALPPVKEKKPQVKVARPKEEKKISMKRIKEIQRALKNAGYDPGPIDGKMGKLTRGAIKEFQKDNGLPETGEVDEVTWGLLKEWLELK